MFICYSYYSRQQIRRITDRHNQTSSNLEGSASWFSLLVSPVEGPILIVPDACDNKRRRHSLFKSWIISVHTKITKSPAYLPVISVAGQLKDIAFLILSHTCRWLIDAL